MIHGNGRTSPEDLGDGLEVGKLDLPGTDEAVKALVENDKAGKFQNLDSLLLWKDGKLIFEIYSRRGRVDAPHYAMSITKTLTSVTLARAIQLGHLSIDDLDKPVIDFISGIGAGGQYMSTFPDLDIVLVATSHNKGNINAPLQAALDHLIPLFTDKPVKRRRRAGP